MDIVVRTGDRRDSPNREYRYKFTLLDVTHADAQARVHLRGDSADHDGSAASTTEASNHQRYARRGHESFDERSHNLEKFAVENFRGFRVKGGNFIDQLAASVVGGNNGGSMARKWVVMERLLQIVSVTKRVAISRRASRFKLQLRDRQEARRSRVRANDKSTPMAWGWSLKSA